ncbi:hypothetical protein IWZ03DRAFT_323994 [Phyllosticta citriasiana]|uniref:Aminoacyl-transfer RNA synthetases class-II family profile domain-containing protein n=1 Tax=Phyllosticta citriasiana TaxID=595635 RepID=A0ABR1KU25_9PEZI
MLVGPRQVLLLLRPLCPRSALPSHTVRLLSTSSRSTIARLLNTDPSSSSSLAQHSQTPVAGETVSVNGWVRSVRKQKRMAFAAVGDGSSLAPLQVVMSPELATGLSTGVGVAITGQWQPSPPGKQQAQELRAQHIRVLGENDSAKFHTTDFLRTLPHLRTRTPFNSLMLRLRSYVIAQVTAFFAARDYVQAHPPVITSSDCEGAGEVFSVVAQGDASNVQDGSAAPGEHFFRHPKYLTVSSQLHLEALSQSVGKVWCLSPAFRAEKSSTPRHLSEFYMLETELSFVEQLDEVMDAVEEMLRHVAVKLRDSGVGRELLLARSPEYSKGEGFDGITAEALSRRWEGLCRSHWPRISFAEAVTRLQDAQNRGEVSFKFAPSYDHGLQTEHEAFIANSIGQGSPVFVTDYPRSVKPFYMSPTSAGSSQHHPLETVACFDLLVPDTCELVGGSLREHRLPELLAAMDSHGLKVPTLSGASEEQNSREMTLQSSDDDASLQWYADLRRFGSVPHGGYGLGFDRLLSYLSGVPNLRDEYSCSLSSRHVQIQGLEPFLRMPWSVMASEWDPTCIGRPFDRARARQRWPNDASSAIWIEKSPGSCQDGASLSVEEGRDGVAMISAEHRSAGAAGEVARGNGHRKYTRLHIWQVLRSGFVHGSSKDGRTGMIAVWAPPVYRISSNSVQPCATSTSERKFSLASPLSSSAITATIATEQTPGVVAYMAAHDRVPAPVEEVADYESLPPNYSLAANMTAGAFAGIAEHSVMYPIDLLKTRMQVANPSPAAVYSGISNAMITITRLEGFRTLWRGVSSVVLGAGPAHAVYFATYEAVKHAAGGNEGGKHEHHPIAAALSGAAATIASDALMNPFDVIKQRMQLHGSSYKSLSDCAKSVFRREGIGAFYVSYPTTLCMTVPFTALQFVAYESLSKTMNPTGRWDPYTHCTAGGLAGGLAAGVTTPLDVIKTLLQTRGSAAETELRNVRGLLEAAKIIKRRDGWRGFFRGLKPRIVTTMPSTAICWSVTAYEMAKAFFISQSVE